MVFKEKLKLISKIVLGRNYARRNLTVFPDDIFITSFPKSGNTWVRFIIGKLLYDEEITFLNIEKKVPDIYQSTDSFLLNLDRPRYLKSHEYFDPRYKTIIYIVRDPRDIAVSMFYFFKKLGVLRENDQINDEFIVSFINGDFNTFGSWSENVSSWLGTVQYKRRFLLLKYEDLLNDIMTEVNKICSFLKINVNESAIKRAVEDASSDKMKKMEVKQQHFWKPIKNSDYSIPFVRSCKYGQWKHELSLEHSKMIKDAFGRVMTQLDYM